MVLRAHQVSIERKKFEYMNGRELARQLLTLHQEIKTLFMSGYTANEIAHRGVLDEGVHFIPKPLSMKDLAFKVRAVLDDAKIDFR